MRGYSVDPYYKKLVEDKEKLIVLLKILVEGKKNMKDLETISGFSHGAIHQLIWIGKKWGYIACEKIDHKKNYVKYRSTKPKGRPKSIFKLTVSGWYFISNDIKVKKGQNKFEKGYNIKIPHSFFDSDEKFSRAIEQHPILKKYDETNYFMNDVVSQTTLNPFLYVNPRAEEVVDYYGELIGLLEENVKSEHILSYYQTLDEKQVRTKKGVTKTQPASQKNGEVRRSKRIS